MPAIREALGLVLALAFAPLGALAQPASPPPVSQPLPQDPAIRRGVLPNGLNYAVMRNATPKDGLSIRLYMDVGSREENEAERGAAHFVEHMAFRGTRNFPEGELERALALVGVGAGRDHNAATTVDATSYRLDLADAAPANLDLAFRWLRDVADGVVFDPDAMDRERGVVLAEKEARDEPDNLIFDKVMAFEGPTLRTTQRSPIGTEASLKAMTPALLRGFYERWYRPQNAWVIVVGDLPPEQMEAAVRTAFADWTGKGAAPARAEPGRIDATRRLEALTLAAPQSATALSACRVQDTPPLVVTDAASLRRNSLRQLWLAIINARLDQLTQSRTTLIGAEMMVTDMGGAQATCLSAAPNAEAWDEAMGAAQQELRRFERDGPTELEVDQGLVRLRNALRSDIIATPTQASADLADDLADALPSGWVEMEPRAALRAFNLAVEGLAPAEVRTAFTADWAGSGPLLVLTSPTPPSSEALQATWRRNEAAEGPAKYADVKAADWAYGPLPEPGKIARRETVAAAGMSRVTFRNGVILNFKKTRFETGSAALRLWFGQGRGEIADRDRNTADLASALFPYGALGRHSYDELSGIFSASALDFELNITDYGFVIDHVVSDETLSSRLRLLAAYMSDPGFRDTLDAKLPTGIDNLYRRRQGDLPGLLREAVIEAVAPGSPMTVPDRSAIEHLTSADFAAVLKRAVTQDPIEITLVGDLDETTAIDLVARTFGALPARHAPAPSSSTFVLRFPATPPPEITTTHRGSPDKAAVAAIWPLYVAAPSRRREEDAIRLLADVFSDELRHRVRERLGKTYSPSVFAATPDYLDQGELDALVETYPADVEAVRDEVLAVAARLAAGEITPQMLEAARTPMLSGARSSAATNDWWADALGGSAHHPEWMDDAVHQNQRIQVLTLADVKAAAATWLARPPIVAVIRPETRATGGAR